MSKVHRGNTQIEVIRKAIKADGFVNNFDAIEHGILRLGAIIHNLRKYEDFELVGAFGSELKNCEPGCERNFYYMTPAVAAKVLR